MAIKEQSIGIMVNEINSYRIMNEIYELANQDINFSKAISEIYNIRNFVGTPENILGSELTKHGEIAEQVEVGISNARSYIKGGGTIATFEGVGRTAPEDYIVNGLNVQSKFYNGINNSLKNGILGHLEKYQNFTEDGGFYHIPKDQYLVIQKILNGETVENLNSRTMDIIKLNISKIEQSTGKSFMEVVKPAISDYSEVQQGVIHKTLNSYKKEIISTNEQRVNEIKIEHKPSFQEGFKTTAGAAAVGGVMSFTINIYKHYNNGKNIFKNELSKEELKELGIDTAKGAVLGGITGASIYGLTNYASLSAPFAAAVVGASKSLSSLAVDYKNGEITLSEFIDMGFIVCSESSIVGIATAAGQTIIPIPALGAVIGSLTGIIMLKLLGEDSGKTATKIKKEMNDFLNGLDEAYIKVIDKIKKEFDELGDLTTIAFDLNLNTTLLSRSLDLARAYGVKETLLLKNKKEIDNYFLN
ncbi:hypothetical protein [Aliarcobacter butzleri]|uniref:hypothetical protein n=1 Tax=Aliarcobacter butzleri TaxID=28197 RepID=UPI002B245CCC|nr:hypothetical protein [Aliarcobacter butzleri]